MSVRKAPKIKIIFQSVELPAHGLMERGEPVVRFVHPEKPGPNAALMHQVIKIILQLEEIETIAAQIIQEVVIHPCALKLKTDRPEYPLIRAVNNDLLIHNVTEQPIFRWQMIGVLIEGLEEVLVNRV